MKNKNLFFQKSKSVNNSLSIISKKDLDSYPEITLAINKDRLIKFELLNELKPKIISTRNIKNQRKVEFIQNLNTFRKTYYTFLNNKKKTSRQILRLNKQNNLFEKEYNEYFTRNLYNFSALKLEYDKKNLKFPKLSFKDPLFKKGILTSDQLNVRQLILYGEKKKGEKSLNYLKKIQEQVDSLKYRGKLKAHFSELFLKKYYNVPKIKHNKHINYSKEISEDIKSISEIKNTYENINDLESFYEKNLNNETNIINNKNINEIKEKELYQPVFIRQNFKDKSIRLNKKVELNEKKKLFQQFQTFLVKAVIKSLNKRNTAEVLYNKISKSHDQLKFDKKIRNYLEKKEIYFDNDISTSTLYKQLNEFKKKILNFDFKKNLDLRKISENKKVCGLTKIEFEKYENYLNKKIIDTNNKIIDVYCRRDK